MTVTVHNLFNGDGVTTDFAYTFDVLGSFSTVVVSMIPDGEDQFQIQEEGTDYTLQTGNVVSFTTAPPPGTGNIKVERFTDRERQVDYEGGSTLTEANLDNDANRLTSVDQEIEAGSINALRKNQNETAWDGEGIPSENCGPAVRGDGWVTLTQANNILAGAETVVIDAASIIIHSGGAMQTEFELPGFQGLIEKECNVHVDSVYQTSDRVPYTISHEGDPDYPSGGTGNDFIIFSEAPVAGAKIEIKVIGGTVATVLNEDSVDGSMIADDSIGTRHINVGAGDDLRFLVFDSSGDPEARLTFHTDISDFDTGVRENRLDQMATPTTNVDIGNNKLTNVAAGSSSLDAVNFGQLGSMIGIGRSAWGNLNALNENEEHTVDLGFQPDLIALMYDFTDSGWTNTYLFVRDPDGDNVRKIAGGLATGSGGSTYQAPTIELELLPDGFTSKFLATTPDSDVLRRGAYFAVKI